MIECLICGKSFVKLGGHIYGTHKMTTREYKKQFGLSQNTKLTSEDYQEKMRDYNAKHYDRVVKNNLVDKGIKTRYKLGSVGRTKDMVSEQERKRLQEHIKKIGKGRE